VSGDGVEMRTKREVKLDSTRLHAIRLNPLSIPNQLPPSQSQFTVQGA